jgi:hypothetical protein
MVWQQRLNATADLLSALKNHNSSRKKCGKSSHLQKHRDFFLRTAGFSAS